jgi:diketogulonate reductase-like aldo/keto reductase
MWIPSSSSLITLLAQKLLTPLSADPSVSHPMYPNHTLLTLNDGNVLPSPAFGVGSALYQKNATHDVLLALQTGYRHIDNAAIYANEESVGEAIRMGDVKREDLYITTKYDAIEGADVEEEFHASLKKVC